MGGGHHRTRRLRAGTHNGADAAPDESGVDARTHLSYAAREFHPGDVDGPTRWRGVEASSLQQISGVHAGEFIGDDDLARTRYRVGSLLESQRVVIDGDGLHSTDIRCMTEGVNR